MTRRTGTPAVEAFSPSLSGLRLSPLPAPPRRPHGALVAACLGPVYGRHGLVDSSMTTPHRERHGGAEFIRAARARAAVTFAARSDDKTRSLPRSGGRQQKRRQNIRHERQVVARVSAAGFIAAHETVVERARGAEFRVMLAIASSPWRYGGVRTRLRPFVVGGRSRGTIRLAAVARAAAFGRHLASSRSVRVRPARQLPLAERGQGVSARPRARCRRSTLKLRRASRSRRRPRRSAAESATRGCRRSSTPPRPAPHARPHRSVRGARTRQSAPRPPPSP